MDLDIFRIDLTGMPEGITPLALDMDDDFFEGVGGTETHRGSVHAYLEIDRRGKLFSIHVAAQGHVVVSCDRCLDDMEQPVSVDDRIEAKLGESGPDDEDVIVVGEDEGILDLSWPLYELVALAIPVRHVHAPGKCNPAMIRVLEEHLATRSGEEDDEPTDPRWDALKKLKTDK